MVHPRLFWWWRRVNWVNFVEIHTFTKPYNKKFLLCLWNIFVWNSVLLSLLSLIYFWSIGDVFKISLWFWQICPDGKVKWFKVPSCSNIYFYMAVNDCIASVWHPRPNKDIDKIGTPPTPEFLFNPRINLFLWAHLKSLLLFPCVGSVTPAPSLGPCGVNDGSYTFCVGDRVCIPSAWVCDGHVDCPTDGFDESRTLSGCSKFQQLLKKKLQFCCHN